jgi:lipopolysaccharide/colanic/teichoic acid biosynthesis glycosyltransferase
MISRKRIAILGHGPASEQCSEALADRFHVVESPHSPSALETLAQQSKIDAVVLADPEAPLSEQLEQADSLLKAGLDVLLLRPEAPHGIDGLGLVLMHIGPWPLLHLRARPVTRRPSLPKRLFDLLFSAVVVLLGALPAALLALIIKLQDRGPVFFVQERVGAGGRTFRFIKFRTMWPDADRHRAWYEQRHGQDGHLFKLADDPRRTPIGRLLRRFSIDELPQFLHVLTGRMSVVGPRPPLPSEVARYRPHQRLRLAGWFGITGLWQICGRAEVRNLDEIVLLDTLYLHNHSARLDLQIILRTLRSVLTRHGAY